MYVLLLCVCVCVCVDLYGCLRVLNKYNSHVYSLVI